MNIKHSEQGAIVLFDGVCHLCQSAVKFMIKRDLKGHFHYASLQSAVGRRLIEENGVNAEHLDTIVLFDKNNYYIRSTAALHIAKGLSFPWPLLYGFVLIPRFIRDAIYRVIAANRYRLFGRDETCLVPTKELRRRFLEDDQHLT